MVRYTIVGAFVSSTCWLLVVIVVLLFSLGGCEIREPVTKKGLIVTLRGHKAGVPSVAFSPDGTIVASGSLDTTVRLWDVATGKRLATLQGHRAQVNAVPFSPDGKLLASGEGIVWSPDPPRLSSELGEHRPTPMYTSEDKTSTRITVIVWDIATGIVKKRLTTETPVHTVAFSPDGKTLVAGGGWPDHYPDDVVWMWDVTTGETKVKWQQDIVWSIAFSPEGTILAMGGGYGEGITLRDVVTGEVREHLRRDSAVRSVAFSPNGKLVAAGEAGGAVLLWDWAKHQNQVISSRHEGVVDALAFNPDGTILASAGEDGTVAMWDVVKGETIARIRIPRTWVGAVAFSPNGRFLATGSSDALVRLWNVAEVLKR